MRSVPLLVLSLAVACGGSRTEPEQPPAGDRETGESFRQVADQIFMEDLAAHPSWAVSLGLHEYDGRLPEIGSEAIGAHIEALRQAERALAGFDPAALSQRERLERSSLLASIRGELFELVERAQWRRNPMFYNSSLSLSYYISRDYAPLPERAAAVAALAEATPAYLETARQNLVREIPRTWLETALLQVRGTAEFVAGDVREALAGIEDPELAARVDAALTAMAAALSEHQKFLESLREHATDDFRLGEERFLTMLRASEELDIDLDRLRRIGQEDLERNLALLAEAAARIDPDADPMKVAAQVEEDRPAPDQVLAEARQQAEVLRAQLREKDIVSIPSEDVAEVRPSPPFMRWNSAFLSSAGPFEERELPSFYYISPPDPSWPKEEQEAYIPSRGDLWSTTAHELWPGHFLHALHRKQNESRILKTVCSYAMAEGWAHYTEEMMWNQGALGEDPKIHVGQLGDALLRNVRYLSAIGLHAGDMTVDESRAMFEAKAFQDLGNAKQQARRGTFDPGYLNYTLGKLMIRKLREDWKAKMGADYSLKKFHDTFLSHGCAPIPAIRRAMLGEDAGPAL